MITNVLGFLKALKDKTCLEAQYGKNVNQLI